MFKVIPDPTFWMTFMIPVAGSDDAPLTLQCKRWTKEQVRTIGERYEGKPDLDVILDIVVGWKDVDVEFGADSMRNVLSQYPMAGREICNSFVAETMREKRKN